MFSDKLKIRVKIVSIAGTKDKLCDTLFGLSQLFPENEQISLDDIKLIYRSVLTDFPVSLQDSSLFREALHRSLENYLIGHGLSTELRKMLSVRLAGNMQIMKLGSPISYPVSKSTEGYSLAKVVQAFSSDAMDNHTMVMELITGPTAGDIIEFSTASNPLVKRVMRVSGLYTRELLDDDVFINPAYMYGMYLFIRPMETERGVFVKDLGTSGSLKSRNRRLQVARTVKRNCRRDFEWNCSVCPLGEEGCPLATHRLNAERGICPLCGEEEWLNPETQGLMSFDCKNEYN